MTMFVDRERELKDLESWFKKGKVAVVTGRRRVGKSRLILEFIKNKKSVYLLSAEKDIEYNLQKFSEKLSEKFDTPGLRFGDFEEMFEFLERRKDIDIIALDEFGYLIRKGALGEFQRIVDKVLKTKKLILSGSSVSLMESKLLGYRSPLYGRIGLIKRLLPLEFRHLFDWFSGIKMEDAVKLYAVTSGIPRYLEFFEGKNVDKEIKERMFNPDILLLRDTKFLLEEELPEPARYLFILESIAFGKNKLSEISNYSKIDTNQIPYYLKVLRNLKFIEHEKPLFEKKKGVYKISDFYMDFWFRFISPFYEEIESGINNNALYNFKKGFNTFLGYVFEQVCKEFLLYTKFFDFDKVGRWWYKDKEIDMVAINKNRKEILFGECKWTDKANAEKIVKKLDKKAKHVKWNNKKRKEKYVIFAKSFKKKIRKFDNKKVYCFDLKNMERKFKK